MRSETTDHIRDQVAETDDREAPTGQSTLSTIEFAESYQAELNVVEVEDVPPNGGYGWVCTVCTFLTNANTWGVNSV